LLAWETLEPTEARIVRRDTWASPSRLDHCIIGNWRLILDNLADPGGGQKRRTTRRAFHRNYDLWILKIHSRNLSGKRG